MFGELAKPASAARASFGDSVRDSFGRRVLETAFDPIVEAVAQMSTFEGQLDAEVLSVDKMLQELESTRRGR